MSHPTYPASSAPLLWDLVLSDDRTPPEGRVVSSHTERVEAVQAVANVARGYLAAVAGTHVEDAAEDALHVMRDGQRLAAFTIERSDRIASATPGPEPKRSIRVGGKVATGPWRRPNA